ncbi:MAG: hypothetical protein OEW52_00240 [Thermoleophilia bacterium]|nr:hypothetical protein [Thermoleophilia bacterium]
MTAGQMIDVEFYAVVELKTPGYPWRGLAVPRVTKGKPTIPRGAIAIRLRLSVPVSLFSEFIPEGTITLPADASIGRPAIEVHVPAGLEVTPNVRLQLVTYETPEDS